MLTLLALLFLAALPASPQTPVPNDFKVSRPQRPPGTRSYHGYRGKVYLFPGTVVEAGLRSLKVRASKGDAVHTFVVDEESKVPTGLAVGARVTVDYGPTLDAATYRVLQVKPLADKKKFPAAKGPLQP